MNNSNGKEIGNVNSFDPMKNDSIIDDLFEYYKLLKTPMTRSMLAEMSKELLTVGERIILFEKIADYLCKKDS